MKEWIKSFFVIIALLASLWLVSYVIAHGWYTAKSLVSIQDNLRIIDAYIAKQAL